MRGMLTKEINEIAKRMIGREITQIELRLIPHIQYLITNEQKLNPNRINSDERTILKKWRSEGFFEGGMTGISITKKFWDFMCEILFEGYVKPSGGEIQ